MSLPVYKHMLKLNNYILSTIGEKSLSLLTFAEQKMFSKIKSMTYLCSNVCVLCVCVCSSSGGGGGGVKQ